MAETLIVKPLGLVLQKAGLISLEQVKIALEAKKTLPNCKIGEILAIRGWIKPETANFFAEQWPKLLLNQELQPIGQYLKAAGFISDRQIEQTLQQQANSQLKFGDYAVLQGWISRSTLNFLLQQLALIRDNQITTTTLQNCQDFNRIESYILHNQQCDPNDLLKLYQQIRQQGAVLSVDNRLEEQELIKSGLVIKQDNKLKIANSQYKSIFDRDWIEAELVSLQPYTQIRLKMFGLEQFASLPYKVLTAVSHWTANQPFLTQKIYQTIRDQKIFIAQGAETATIDHLVQKYVIQNWERGIAATHFKQIQHKLLDNQQFFSTESLLETYQNLWQQGTIKYDGSPQQNKLLDIGLAKRENELISLSNPIYHAIFDGVWIRKQLKVFQITPLPISSFKQNLSSIMFSQNLNSQNSSRRVLLTGASILGVILSGTILYGFGQQLWQTNSQKQLIAKGDRQLQAKNYAAALASYNQALRVNQDIANLWLNRAYALKGLEAYRSMLESCAAATVIQPESESVWNCRGEALFHLQEYSESVKVWEKALAINDQNPIVWINYGEALHKLEQYQVAEIAIQRAIDLLENDPQADSSSLPVAYNGQGKTLLKQQKYSQALEAFTRSLVYAPNYLSAQQGKALALTKLGQNQEAGEIFEQVLVRDDLSAEQKAITWLYKGINFCEMQQPNNAKNAFARALRLGTEYDAAVKTAQEECR
ncbi:MAG TPA: tetratricopeptide repeat protein [Xenococcaceae cyanobacterium]